MNYYIPSYQQNSRINFRRRRSKKPLIFILIFLSLFICLFLMGFGSRSPESPDIAKNLQEPAPSSKEALTDNETTPDNIHPGAVKSSHLDNQASLPTDSAASDTLEQQTAEAADSLREKTIPVDSGDTLIKILTAQGLDNREAHKIITALHPVFNPRKIRQGHEITLAFQEDQDSGPVFQNMNLKLDVTRSVQVSRCPEKGFVADENVLKLATRPVRVEAEINSSLYSAATDIGMPVEVLMQMIRAYSFDVDFQRDIRPGDHMEVLFEEEIDEHGRFVQGGSVLYATLKTRGRALPIYRYETSDGEVDFFNSKGQSVRKTLMVTPVDGARLSSGYGKRRHPILGYSRMHQGLDFAAPSGTPIMAAGDGIIEYAGRKGNYGNYIRIRHPNEYHTVYAHMSRFASGMRKGARVRQGETIGYIGSTGLSTGPHLHYEVHHRGGHINPRSVDTPPGRTLKGEELERFYTAKNELEVLLASLKSVKKLARMDLNTN
ncbi:MAG: M23 family metallopeptidase [Desulfonatronovibrio sp.]